MSEFKSFYNFSLRSSPVTTIERCWFAHFNIDNDFSHLFPFIQSSSKDAIHYESPECIQFKLNDILCTLYPPDIVASRFFYGREQALEFAGILINYLNELSKNKSQLQPNFKKFIRLYVPDILHFLPMTNCGECGFQTCMAFAGAVSRRKTYLSNCPDFPDPIDAKITFSVNNQYSEEAKSIEVDLDLAGVAVSRISDVSNSSQPRIGRSKSLIGSRDGILFKLSGRETEVIRLIAEGFTNKEIAQILKISHHTVKSHVVHVFNKIGVNDRTQVAVWAAQNGLI